MELNGTRIIPATVEQTWAALNDPEVLKRCINGCESLERVGDDGLAAVVALKVGPVSARFKGSVKLLNVQAPNSYTLQFDGQGGVAGFGKGSADVSLLPAPEGDPGHTQLSYAARATVGGKMAQVGSRLVDAAAGKITEDFFTAFESVLREMHAAPAPAPAAGVAPVAPADAVVSPFERAVAMASPTHAAATAAAQAAVSAAAALPPAATGATASASQPSAEAALALPTATGAAPAPASASALASAAATATATAAAAAAAASATATVPVSAPLPEPVSAHTAAQPGSAPVGGNGLKWAAVAVLAALVLYFVLR